MKPFEKCVPLSAAISGPGRILILLGFLSTWILGVSGVPVTAQVIADLPPQFDLNSTVQLSAGGGTVRINFNVQPDGNGYALAIQGDGLAICHGKISTGLLSVLQRVGFSSASVLAKPAKITLKRSRGGIEVLLGDALVMQVEDSAYSGGTASLTFGGGAASSPLKMQPVEAMYFSDDFMRQPDEKGEWDYVAGKWQIQIPTTVKDQTFDKVAKWGSNPFALEAEAAPLALATSGYPFWSDYRFEVAVKGTADSVIGMCVDLKDAQNYYLLRWTTGPKGALMLWRVIGGKATELGKRDGGYIPDLWYALSLRTAGGLLVAEVDHRVLLKAEDTTFGQGKIGLYAEGPAARLVRFDSVLVRPANVFFDSFEGARSASAPRWDIQGQLAVGGDPSWDNYSVSSEVAGTSHDSALITHYQDPNNYYLFTWGATSSRLFAVSKGQYRLLAAGSVGVPVGKTASVELTYTDGYLSAAIDGRRVVEGLEFEHPKGRAGFQPASDAGPGFHNISVAVVDPPEATDALTNEFTKTEHHKEMQGWSGALRGWETAAFEGDSGYWHKMDMFGDTTVKIPLTQELLTHGRLDVLMNADGKTEDSGYCLSMSRGTNGLALSLKRLGVEVAKGTAHAPDTEEPVLEMYRQGPFVCATVCGFLAIGYHDTDPLDGYALSRPVTTASSRSGHSRVGIVLRSGNEPDMANVVVNNRHVYAETFHLAPVNWRPQSGTWEVTSRWACTPGWTWYGGKNDGYAVNWYKSPLWGDQCIDAYGGIMMSPLPGKPGESWRDLNCMFCGDGVNLFSGYTFVVDGWNGAHSRLLRKGKLVAESDDFQFPPHAIAHRLWFNTRIRLHGGNIQIVLSYYDAKAELHTYPLIDWVDPNPLPGGFAGFWTYNNGIMLARAVLAAQSEGQRPIYTVNKAWTTRLSEDAPYPGYPDAGEVAKPILNSDDVAAELGLGGPGNPASWPQSRATAAASMVAILGSGE